MSDISRSEDDGQVSEEERAFFAGPVQAHGQPIPDSVKPATDNNPPPPLKQEPLNQVPKTNKSIFGNPMKLVLIGFIFVVVMGIIVTTAILLITQFGRRNNSNNILPSPSASPNNTVSGVNDDLIYIKDHDVYSYSFSLAKETRLTSDGTAQIQYRLPKWSDSDKWMGVRCQFESEAGVGANTCSLIEVTMQDASMRELANVSSQTNSNGSPVGGYILAYALNPNKATVSFVSHEVTENTKDFGIFRLHALNLSDKSDRILGEFEAHGGRGGTLDDEMRLEFSRNGQQLLFVDTTLYPSAPEQDKGTIFVYDLDSGGLIWHKPGAWTTFAHWWSDSVILAKQQIQSPGNALWQLVRIDLTLPQEGPVIETIADASNWYFFELIQNEKVIFNEINTAQNAGIILSQYYFGPREVHSASTNLLKVTMLSNHQVLVRTMKKCSDTGNGEDICGMNPYNGFIPEGLATFDLNTNQLKPLTMADSYKVSDISSR